MNLPIARGLRGLIYVLWELSQVDPSDLSILFAGPGRLRIGFSGIEASAGQEPGDDEIDRATSECWENPYYAFSKPPGTSLVCIQGDWSNVADARIKGRLATLAMNGQGEAAYTPLYARAVHSPRPWGVTMLLAEHTGAHQPLDVDWSFARESPQTSLHADRVVAQARPDVRPESAVAPPVVAPPVVSAPPPKPPARVVAMRPEPKPEPASAAASFASLLEFAVAVNRADPAALALARGTASDIPIDGAEVRKLLGTLWFRGVVPRLSAEWRTRLFDALLTSGEIPDHVVRVGRQQARLSALSEAQLRDVVANRMLPDAVRQDVELVAAVARVWGDEAVRLLEFDETAVPPVTSGFASLLQGIGIRPKSGARGAR
jgi:hypothetical protein